MINTKLFQERIEASGKKKKFLAEKCGLSPSGFSNRIHNRAEFKSAHIKILCDELEIVSKKDRENIFFTTVVH